MKILKFILFFAVLTGSLFSCKTNFKPQKETVASTDKNEIAFIKDFPGVYSVKFIPPKKGIAVYSVEFKADRSARVLLFKTAVNSEKDISPEAPDIISGKWLRDSEGIIILYFSGNIPSEFFSINQDGSLSILNENKKPYGDNLKEVLILKKIK